VINQTAIYIALYGCEQSASRPGRLISDKRARRTYWTEGWMNNSGGLNVVVQRNPCCSHQVIQRSA